jgi:hypothetical protein
MGIAAERRDFNLNLSLRRIQIDTIGADRECQTAARLPLTLTPVAGISYTGVIRIRRLLS